MDATCEDGNTGSCGGNVFDCAYFSHAPGVVWQCFPEILDNPSVGVLVMKRKFDNILLEAMMAMRAFWERLSGHEGDGEHQEDL